MSLTEIVWLSGFSSFCVTVAFASWRGCRNLALLAGAFALNAIAFIWLPGDYLVLALADLVMALLCIVFWCWASRWVASMSLFLMVVNLVMFAWYSHPVPYDTFMVAYELHPYLIRFLEALQLCVMIYFTPAIYRLARRPPKETREPPCHRLTAAR